MKKYASDGDSQWGQACNRKELGGNGCREGYKCGPEVISRNSYNRFIPC